MKKYVLFFLFCAVLPSGSSQDATGSEDALKITSHTRRSGMIYEWRIPMTRLKALPKWNPDKHRIPLTFERAFKLARSWITKQGYGTLKFASVEIASVNPGGYFRDVYYYRFTFELSPFDRIVAVITMDRSVVEPVLAGNAFNDEHR